MQAIRLDYVTPAASVAGIAVFIAACGCAGVAWQYASSLQQQNSSLERAITQAKREAGIQGAVNQSISIQSTANQSNAIQGLASRMPAAPVSTRTAEMQQAWQVAAFLLVPWSELFNALEAAAMADAVLLSIEPDAKKQRLTLIAEAKNKDVLFKYLQRLEATPQLSGVYMLKHEVLQDLPQQPIRFVLTAAWEETP